MKKSLGVLCMASFLMANQSYTLNNITVTAQKQDEKEFDIPINLTLFDEYKIEDLGIKEYTDLSALSAGLSIIDYGNAGVVGTSLRGISTDTSIESTTVGVYVDGIPYLGTVGNDMRLENIERIEILKGPQGTLYGKNAYGGVINIITKKPDNDFKGKIAVELAEDNKKELSANIGGAIIKDKLYLSLSGKKYEKDGFMKNIHTNKNHDDRKHHFGKSYLRYVIDDKMEIALISSWLKHDDKGALLNLASAPDYTIVNQDADNYVNQDIKSHALKFDYNFDTTKFSTLITDKRHSHEQGNDNDYSPAPVIVFYSKIQTKENTLESKIEHNFGNLNLLGGLYLDNLKTDKHVAMNTIAVQNFDLESRSLGLFVNAKYALTPNLNLQLGARLDKDKLELTYKPSNTKKDASYNSISPKIALNYKHSDNLSFYTVISKGYKSGGFYLFAPAGDERYDAETLINYEIGLKSVIANKLKLNISAYFMPIKDKQVVIKDVLNTIQYLKNAGSAQSKGIDIEATYHVNSNLQIFSTLGLNETKFTSYRDSAGNYTGNINPFSPKATYSLGATYRADNGIFASAVYKGTSSIYSDRENLNKSEGSKSLDLKVGYEMNNFEIYAYAKNAEDTIQITKYGAGAFLSSPREIGMKVAYRF